MNLSRLVLLGAVAIVLLASGCNKPATKSVSVAASPGGTPDEFAATRANYAKHCASCHGEKGDGGTVTVEGKKLKVPSLRTGHCLTHPDREFVQQITKGGDGMPAFSEKLSTADVNDMVRFIRKDFEGGFVAPTAPGPKMH